MTTRPLLTIQRYSVCDGWPTPGIEASDFGRVVLYSDHLADRANLLTEIARLEAMVPRWVAHDDPERIALLNAKWTQMKPSSWTAEDEDLFWLMVPPIPLPEPKGGK